MRYNDWDVILFPRDSHVPIQEFKTACFVSQVEYGRQLPTLTCFITSLPPSTPFRISLHSWRTTLKASALLESRRKGNQKIVFAVQVIVGEARLFHGFFDLNTKWPQEIAYEKRSLTFNDLPSSQRKRPLEFPPFNNLTLTNNIWDARDPYGRIRVVLSEQLISKTQSPGSLDFGTANELVCFSFQHAPKDILQQTGISWPISNPLYLPDAFNRDSQYPQASPTTSWTPDAHPFIGNMHMQTPQLHNVQPVFTRLNDAEPKRQSNAHLPPVPHFPTHFVAPTSHTRRATTWNDAFSTLNHTGDTASIDDWSEKRKIFALSDHPMPNYMYGSHTSTNGLPWMGNMSQHVQSESTDWDDYSKPPKEKQFVVTLRDDQLGQIIDAISPPKHNREISRTPGGPFHEPASQQAAHTYYPPKFGTAPSTKRPSSGVLARKLSYQDSSSVLRNVSNKPSSHKYHSQDDGKDRMSARPRLSMPHNKEDIGSSQLRFPTPFPHANRVPTPNPFAQGQPATISELSMRDWSSTQASAHRVNRSDAPQSATEISRLSSAQGPSNFNSRSRNEGLMFDSPKLSDQATRQDECSMPTTSSDSQVEQSFVQKVQGNFAQDDQKSIPGQVEIIDVDAVDPSLEMNAAVVTSNLSPFKPTHKSRNSQSSTDSTDRLERQLFSALGEELGSFDHHHHHHYHQIDTTDMGPELMHALGGARTNTELSSSAMLGLATSNFEPAVKRKRQGTLGRGSNGSPMSKKEKADGAESKEQREIVVSMRGG
ncbi:hypothetical protein COCSADRAFT_151853 [Bipolaris sorokiniana ND90Pr]|uniref:Uncharacterized protein n=1 Tax=Cochliobolus sativus (strain ND90Pr / ATCC 201652) TaxID=665912 RepID=M2SRU9_COCSN|nr:uncharacterized protein COCSADRAFT_151853 [Bipolaris sorokiniana ND90Pr]EMD59532.1 hypothetical protein COCSADRAFT_151853 [Bipolaris sorokiniana ND90Pr]